MKTIKIFSLAVLMSFGLFVSQSNAQTFGVKAGLNLANMHTEDDSGTLSDDFKSQVGFHAGVTAEFPITEMLSFEAGLLASTKGFKQDSEETILGTTVSYKASSNLLYVDVPLTLKATFGISDGANLFVQAGPYLGMGLSGKYKTETTVAGQTEKEESDIKWGSNADEDDLKRMDFGLTGGAGVEFNNISVGLSYGLGLANISAYTEENAKINNRVLGISVGYKFGGK
jgi:opacity protein-like surface antigen